MKLGILKQWLLAPARLSQKALVLLSVGYLTACVSTADSYTASSDNGLAPDEGLMLMRVSTDWPLDKLVVTGRHTYNLNQSSIDYNTDNPDYVVVKLEAGDYRIERLRKTAYDSYIFYFDVEEYPDLWHFTIEAGKINYVGDFEAKSASISRLRRLILRNRSSWAYEYMQRSLPQLLQQFPMVYSGPGRDDFFEQVQSPLATTAQPAAEAKP